MYQDDLTKKLAESAKAVIEGKKMKETEVQPSDKDFVDLHSIDKEKRRGSTPLTEKDVEEANEFTKAAAKAAVAGDDEFEFDGKKFPTEMDVDVAKKILGESVESDESSKLTESNTDKYMWSDINNALKAAGLDIRTILSVVSKLKGKEIKEDIDLTEAKGFPESSQGAKNAYNAVVKLSASLRKGSNLNKAVNKRLGGKYDSDFVEMEKAIAVISDILDEFDIEYQSFNESNG